MAYILLYGCFFDNLRTLIRHSLHVSDPTTECPSGTHTDTHVEVHAHTLLHTQGQLRVITPASREVHMNLFQCFSTPSSVLVQHLLLVGCRNPPKKSHRNQYSMLKSIQHCQVGLCRGWDTVNPVVKKMQSDLCRV